MRNYILPGLFIMLLALNSCTERIDIDLKETYVRLTVEGYITHEPHKQWIKLSRTSDYFYNNPSPAVSDAIVTVKFADSVVVFNEDPTQKGFYYPPDSFVGFPGMTYSLEILLNEPINNSLLYQSEETMPVLTDKLDSITLEYDTRWEKWLVHLYAWEPPSVDYYLFNAMNNGQLLTDSLTRMIISDDKLFNGNYTNGSVVQVLNKDEVNPGDTITLVLSNITQSYFDFILGAQQEIEPKNPLFSGPAANVRSNINNNASGYFAAFPSAYIQTVAETPEEW